MKTDKRIWTILQADKILMKCIDPDNITASGKITKIRHTLPHEGNGFLWKTYLSFPSGDMMIISGQYHNAIGMMINRCRLLVNEELEEITITPSDSLYAALGNLSDVPVHLKRNLSRIDRNKPKNEGYEGLYDDEVIDTAKTALFWEMDILEVPESIKKRFTEITFFMHSDKTDIVGVCPVKRGRIIAKTSVDIYGLGGKNVTVEKKMYKTDEVSAYCYTEDQDGRKIPSIRMAFTIDSLLSDADILQKREIKRLEVPQNAKKKLPANKI